MAMRLPNVALLAIVLLMLSSLGCGRTRPTAVPDHLPWLTSFSEAQAAAKAAGKPLVVDFWATWCGPCHMLAEKSFPHSRVQALKNEFIWAKVDVDRNAPVAARYSIRALPTVLILDGDGNVISASVGYTDGDSLTAFLQQGLAKSRLLKPGT
jgi:thioredoxin-like negative regulator of GroEL